MIFVGGGVADEGGSLAVGGVAEGVAVVVEEHRRERIAAAVVVRE